MVKWECCVASYCYFLLTVVNAYLTLLAAVYLRAELKSRQDRGKKRMAVIVRINHG